jgi:UDP-N-acetylmuramate: L-alanyl-gamma-D-glutamyl-meso-diaminopimelate ligase
MGACGVGMAGVAGLFLSTGATVTGSDQSVYAPVSEYLARLGVKTQEGYSPLNLSPHPDLVVIGNVIRKENPEARAVVSEGIPFTSMPGAIEEYFLRGKLSLVVAGSHGKTTLSSMIAWILYDQGVDPGFMIGGLPSNFNESSRFGYGKMFVLEGDEYDSAFFDKRPKFLHYRPFVGIFTSCEFDHADIYRDLGQIRQAFESFLNLVPEEGAIIACNDDPVVREIIMGNHFRAETYGFRSDSSWNLSEVKDTGEGISVEFLRYGASVASGILPVVGRHNALNALAAVACTEKVGVEPSKAFESLTHFKGVLRRQQITPVCSGILLVDDFAHHPSEVRETLAGFRLRFPDRRIVAVFEPRTNTSRRSIFQDNYLEAFLLADLSVLREPPDPWKAPDGDLFSSSLLSNELEIRGKRARAFLETDSIIDFLTSELRPRDVVVVMSNGSFENLIPRLSKKMEDLGR